MFTIDKAFEVTLNGKPLDYRKGQPLNLDEVISFFQKDYEVTKLWNGGRHALGTLKKGNQELFLKLATTEGISVLTQIEYAWNDAFNREVPREASRFWVPKNFTSGTYNNFFY